MNKAARLILAACLMVIASQASAKQFAKLRVTREETMLTSANPVGGELGVAPETALKYYDVIAFIQPKADDVGSQGAFYIVSVAKTSSDFKIAVFSDRKWQGFHGGLLPPAEVFHEDGVPTRKGYILAHDMKKADMCQRAFNNGSLANSPLFNGEIMIYAGYGVLKGDEAVTYDFLINNVSPEITDEHVFEALTSNQGVKEKQYGMILKIKCDGTPNITP